MVLREASHEVLVAERGIARLTAAEVEDIKRRAPNGRLRRARVCTHPSGGDPLHEMVIAHSSESYVPPHKHPGKSESGHVLEGEVDVVFFDDDGEVVEVLQLAPYGAGKPFYYRVNEPLYHTMLVRTPVAVVHEVTNGPFDPADTVFAPWAPAEEDRRGRERFAADLRRKLADHA